MPPTATPDVGPFAEIFDDLQGACEHLGSTPSTFGSLQLPIMALIKRADQESEWMYQPLPDTAGVVASDAASLRTIACIQDENVLSVGHVYTDGSKAYDNLWRAKFISWPDGQLLSNTEVRFVGYAPGSKPAGGDGFGKAPIEDVITFLQDANQGRLMFVGEGTTRISFSANGRYLAAAYGNGQVLLWELSNRKILNQFSTSQKPGWVALSPDGRKLAFEADTGWGTTQVFEISSGKLLYSLDGGKSTFSPDGRYLAVANPKSRSENPEDETIPKISLVDPETGDLLGGLGMGSRGGVLSMAFTQDGKWLIEDDGSLVHPQPNSSAIEGTFNIWDTEQLSLAYTLNDPIATSAWIEKIAASPTEPLIAFFSFKEGVQLWNFETDEVVQPLGDSAIMYYGQVFSPDGHFLAVNTDDPSELSGCCSYLLDLSDYKHKIALPKYRGLSNLSFSTLAFSQEKNEIYLVSADGILLTMDYTP